MRTIVLLVLACWFGFVVWRARSTGKDHTLLLAFLALVILTTGFFEGRWVLRENKYETVAETFVKRDIDVSCQRTLAYAIDISGYLGYVPYPADGGLPVITHLRNDTCRNLGKYAANPDVRNNPGPEHISAVHVLTHESMHLIGEKDERKAECMAVQRNVDTARALGATTEQAQALASAYYATIYPRMPDSYRSDLCVADGEWDEHLSEPPWPVQAAAAP